MNTEVYYACVVIISVLSIVVNFIIYKLNAGKNRVIYEIEEITVRTDIRDGFKAVNEKLNTGQYTILSTYKEIGETPNRLYCLGKIK